jgi:hypothetical protein
MSLSFNIFSVAFFEIDILDIGYFPYHQQSGAGVVAGQEQKPGHSII